MTIEEVNEIMTSGATVLHKLHGEPTGSYKISGVITRYNKHKGWLYSLELTNIKSGSITVAALEDVQVVARE